MKRLMQSPYRRPLVISVCTVVFLILGVDFYRTKIGTPAFLDAKVIVPDGVEMIYWGQQSRSADGGEHGLTLWADGRSEISVSGGCKKLKPGWEVVRTDEYISARRPNVFSKEDAKQKFQAALAAGIHELKTFEPSYKDGGLTIVIVQINGKSQSVMVPDFDVVAPNEKGSRNHRLFLAVQKILDDYDKQPCLQ
jgi:hypothetical protein